MTHLVIGQRQKAPNFSAFHWSPHGCLITIGQHIVTMRVVHLPKRTETSLIIESDQSRANHQLLQLCTVRTAWSNSDQAVRAVHSCKSWLQILKKHYRNKSVYWNKKHELLSGSGLATMSEVRFTYIHRQTNKIMHLASFFSFICLSIKLGGLHLLFLTVYCNDSFVFIQIFIIMFPK